jgi:threonine dehydrogenase-like Zn-dependent dehydrogenase
MRQLVLTEPNAVSWADAPEPDLEGPGEALVRPIAVALCDLDHPMITGGTPIPPPVELGHECVAEVLAVGTDVTTVATGDLVVVPFQVSCGACGPCGRGLTGDCDSVEQLATYGFGGFGHDWGGMLTDTVRVPYADAMLVKVPDGVDPVAIASMSDNIPDGLRLVAPGLAELPGADVLVLGGGALSIGLYAAGAAVALGARRVDYLDTDEQRLAIAADLGADAVQVEVFPYRAQRRYAITVDAGNSRDSLAGALRSTEPGGLCTSTSVLFEATTPVPLLEMYTTGVRFHTGRAMARALIPQALELVAAGRLRPELVTSRVAPWDDAADAVLQEEPKLVLSR